MHFSFDQYYDPEYTHFGTMRGWRVSGMRMSERKVEY